MSIMPNDMQLIENFLERLWLHDGLSDNTRAAYQADLEQFSSWLAGRRLGMLQVQREHLLEYLGWRLHKGYKASSTARFFVGGATFSISRRWNGAKSFRIRVHWWICQKSVASA